MNHYTKWSLFVLLNIPVSLLFALDFMKTIPTALGVVSGIGVFIIFYGYLDKYLQINNKIKGRMALKVGVISCAILLLYPAIPMMSGALALEISGQLLNIDPIVSNRPVSNPLSAFDVFLTTVIDGILLSCIVAILAILARILFSFKDVTEDNKYDK